MPELSHTPRNAATALVRHPAASEIQAPGLVVAL
jgi:hypothetical protein